MKNDVQFARILGLVSVFLGLTEFFTGRRASRAIGLGYPGLIETYGGREIASGVMALAYPDRAWPIWLRLGGDALDAATLLPLLGPGNRHRGNALGALAFVLGVAAADAAVAMSLQQRGARAHATAQRTRIRHQPGTAGSAPV